MTVTHVHTARALRLLAMDTVKSGRPDASKTVASFSTGPDVPNLAVKRIMQWE